MNRQESQDGTQAPFEIQPPKLVADLEKSKAYDLFDTVLGPTASQQQAYDACAAGCVEAVCNGYNSGFQRLLSHERLICEQDCLRMASQGGESRTPCSGLKGKTCSAPHRRALSHVI